MSIDNSTQGINYKGKSQHSNKEKRIGQKRTEDQVRNIITYLTSKDNYLKEK